MSPIRSRGSRMAASLYCVRRHFRSRVFVMHFDIAIIEMCNIIRNWTRIYGGIVTVSIFFSDFDKGAIERRITEITVVE